MSIENNKITGAQFMFTVVCFIQSSALLTSFFISISQQDSWFVVIVSTLIFLPFVMVLSGIAKQFPDKNLIQINNVVFGKVGGKIVSVFYVFFFLSLTAFNLQDLGAFVQKTIMHNTPSIVIISLFLILCAWTIRYGVDVTTRYNILFSLVALLVVATGSMLVAKNIDFNNFLPMLDLPFLSYVQSTHIVITIPYGELVIFLMITPCVKANSKKIKWLFFWGMIIGSLSLLGVVARDTAVLGNMITRFSMPAFETLRIISIAQTLSRVEILFATVLIVLLFAKITILFYVTVLAVAEIFELKGFRQLIIPMGVIILVYSFNLHQSAVEHTKIGSDITPFIWVLFEFMLPLLTFAMIKFKKLHAKKDKLDKNSQEDTDNEPSPDDNPAQHSPASALQADAQSPQDIDTITALVQDRHNKSMPKPAE